MERGKTKTETQRLTERGIVLEYLARKMESEAETSRVPTCHTVAFGGLLEAIREIDGLGSHAP